MGTPIDLIVSAIARQEGFFDGSSTLPRLNNNPGDLRYAGQISSHCPRCGASGGKVPPSCLRFPTHVVANFESLASGVTALYRQVWLQVAEGQTLRQLIYQFAPPNENSSEQYLANVAEWTKLPTEVKILDLLPSLTKISG